MGKQWPLSSLPGKALSCSEEVIGILNLCQNLLLVEMSCKKWCCIEILPFVNKMALFADEFTGRKLNEPLHEKPNVLVSNLVRQKPC